MGPGFQWNRFGYGSAVDGIPNNFGPSILTRAMVSAWQRSQLALAILGPTVGQADIFRDPSGIKDKGIPHPLDAFLGQVIGYLIVRQMAVDALDSAVGPLMPPGLIFGLHDMAGGAEFRGFGRGIEFGRAEGGKQPSGDTDYDY